MLNELYYTEGINLDTLFFRLNANTNIDVSDYEIDNALDISIPNTHRYEVVDSIENERDHYVIEYLSNGINCYERLIDTTIESIVPLWKKKNELRIKLLVHMKQSWADLYVFKQAVSTAISIKQKRFFNYQTIEAKKNIKRYQWLLLELNTV